ncbi:MAG: hypothetical protein ACTHMY_03490 [Solirubrobacteraceae bacterium]
MPTILGTLGVVLALASLGWQAFTFLRSGSRVEVVLRHGATDFTRVVTMQGPLHAEQARQLQSQGLHQPVFGIEVINSGRGPTSVQAVEIAFDNGAAFTGEYLANPPALPHRMEGESETTWLMDAIHVHSAATAFYKFGNPPGQPQVVRGRVRLGGRKKPVVSKNAIRVL